MPTYKTYDVVGKKEDISDIVSNIEPTDTPFVTAIGSEGCSNTLYQWEEDKLAAPRVNRAIEGFTVGVGNGGSDTTQTLTPVVMRDNVTQILETQFAIAGTQEKVATYGNTNRVGYQSAKKSTELKRDLEYALVGTGQAKDAGTGSTPRITAGYQAQIETSNSPTPAPIEAAPDGVAGGALDPSDLTENMLLSLMQKLYNTGGSQDILMIKPGDALKVAGFAGAINRQRDIGNGKKIVNAVDVYVGPFSSEGTKVVLNRWLAPSNALLFSPDMWKLVALRPWFREKLAKDGDREVYMIVGEYGLKHRNFRASGLFTNLK